MNRVLGAVARILLLLVLAASGIYVLVYLYRWEWNRALVAGLLFVATEVPLLALAILGRLHAIEARLDVAAAPVVPPVAPDAPARSSTAFRWLDPTQMTGLSVFVPFLMGAGLLLSGIAYVVEHVAGATAHRRTAVPRPSPVAGLALPTGGLLADDPATTGASTPSRRRPLLTVAAMIGALLLAAAAIDVIEDATQSRRDVSHPSVSRVELRVVNGRSGPAEQTADALWTVCRTVLPASSRAVVAPGPSPSTVSLVVVPGLGEVARRRFTGCLEDATLDRVRADVVRFDDLG